MSDNIDMKIENALKDSNIMKIMNRACKKFRNQLDSDTIHTCQINALWKAFLNHDPNKAAKFTTYLYNGVFIECMKEIKFKNKSIRFSGKLHDNITNNKDPFLMIDIFDELSDDEKQMFIDKASNMTISEMSEKYKTNRESTRRKMHKIIDKLSQNFK